MAFLPIKIIGAPIGPEALLSGQKTVGGYAPPEAGGWIQVLYSAKVPYMALFLRNDQGAGINGGGMAVESQQSFMEIPIIRSMTSGANISVMMVDMPAWRERRAECIPNNAVNNAKYREVAYVPPINLTSETTALLPSNRSRTEIGVGEEVTVKADQKVSWKFSNENLVLISYQDQEKIVFSALDKEGSFTAIAYTEDAEKSISFGIQAPTDIDYELAEYKDANGQYQPTVFHEQGTYELGIGLRMVLYPLSVNFGALIIKELDSAATKTGIFDYGDGRVSCHIRGKGQSLPMGTKCDAESPVTDIGTYNNKHNRATELDVVGGGENDPNRVSNLPKLSSMKLNIPILWKLKGAWYPLTNVVQQVLLNDQKQLTITKGNFSKTVNVNDPAEGAHPSKW